MWPFAILDDKLHPIHFIPVINMKISVLLGIFALTSGLLGHGVSHVMLRDAYGIKVFYEDGNPLEFADIQIFQPGETEVEFQLGMTDENGVFMFRPDTSGLWTVKVSDGLGHGKVISVLVDELNSTMTKTEPVSRLKRIISGVGYILFLFSAWYLFAIRRKG